MRLKNKIAIVTGGGSGFGEGIARRFVEEGCKVIVNDLKPEGGERVAKEILSAGGQAKFVQGDVSKAADWDRLLKATLDAYGSLDIVINNAGTTHRNQPLLECDGRAVRSRLCRQCEEPVPQRTRHRALLSQEGRGCAHHHRIDGRCAAASGLVWYNGSKGAAIVTSRAMAVELAPDKIRVNVVNPVAGDTPLLAEFMGSDTPEMRAKFVASIPLGRFSKPIDIANACLYLASDEANFITGACIEVDGGRCV